MTKEKAQKLNPFDVIVVKSPSGSLEDALVKRVAENGVFCLLRIQSTATLIPFDQIVA